jgi:Transglycosylase SLT domain
MRLQLTCCVVSCLVFGLSMQACSSDETAANDAGVSPDTMTTGSCDTDPLKTGITAQQTGVSADAFDCQVLKWSAAFKEPDPMIFKAIMYGESRFDQKASACPNLPCNIPTGWDAGECGCYGLMQIVPACGGLANDAGLLPNGHPNMTTDTSSSAWSTSIFNPDVNIEVGIGAVAGNRAQVVKQFPGCTTDQYTMMAIGNYANYGSTKSCTQVNTTYLSQLLITYKQYAAAANYPAHNY